VRLAEPKRYVNTGKRKAQLLNYGLPIILDKKPSLKIIPVR